MGEMAKYAIKVGLAVVAGGAMLAALLAIIAVIGSFSSIGILSEMFGLIGIFMPFNVGTVFTFTAISFAALLSFITARKVYEIMSNFAQSTD